MSYGPLRAMTPGRGRNETRCRNYVEQGLVEDDGEFAALARTSRTVLGSDAFGREIREKHGVAGRRRVKAEDVALRRVGGRESPLTVLRDVCERLGVGLEDVCRKRRDGTIRAVAAYALLRRVGCSQREAADRLGLRTGAAVSYLIRQLKTRLKEDRAFASRVERLLGGGA